MREELTDADLLLASRGDPEVRRLLRAPRRRAAPVLRSPDARPETAAELVAETFAEAFASRRRFRDRGHGAAGWLYGIGKHQLSHFFRRGAVDARETAARHVGEDGLDRRRRAALVRLAALWFVVARVRKRFA